MNQVASVCQSCSTTPNTIKTDLSNFLGLCNIQASNGSAANASSFAPLGYKTGQDANPDAPTTASSPASATTLPGVMLAVIVVLLTSGFAVL
ncbi:hypothetical protein CspeluHIS016_0102120 [Cutaneotrichosporon spelunceum]|uniref:Uncharacterized protein n=1 Tax=Cutaneotrichosporon spelunceum TaxID=1672016 RepID=A0AAD3TNM0_9TREE|nr:hypothetical protein CspeluHIS016_0102120 [Cutaneotrichosporon spelunceum]